MLCCTFYFNYFHDNACEQCGQNFFQAVLPTIRKVLEMTNYWSKILETLFICSCILLAPVFSYYLSKGTRQILIRAAGLAITFTVACVLIPDKQRFL
ncbi:hypothetical protein XELAEV_18038618mg [Xenopus laevis]|uniref:Uncharacterized protein n=1 Tax=Xenopus laevis TaxID=8355 RepID=A0A974H744_XENLA|nr:hypothetical protein XELAEV_18038618mg [Xenopus laevis]